MKRAGFERVRDTRVLLLRAREPTNPTGASLLLPAQSSHGHRKDDTVAPGAQRYCGSAGRDPGGLRWCGAWQLKPVWVTGRGPGMRRRRGSAGRRLEVQAGASWDDWWASVVNGVDDFAGVYALEVDRGDPEMGMSELPLDYWQRDPFVGHLNGVGVPELMWREPSANAGLGGELPQLGSGARR